MPNKTVMRKSKISTGGERIGWINASWPLANLSVGQDYFEINATVIGKYSFTPEQVISIEKYTVIPILDWGIKVNHIVPEYPKHIVFWCIKNPENLIQKIKEKGFFPKASRGDPTIRSLMNRSAAVRWQSIVILIIIWNSLCMLDMVPFRMKPGKLGFYSFLAVLLLFMGSISLWRIEWLQKIILKEGREPKEIRQWLYLLSFVSGVMLLLIGMNLLSKL